MFGNLRRCKECGETYYAEPDEEHVCDRDQYREHLRNFARMLNDPARVEIFLLQVEKFLARQARR